MAGICCMKWIHGAWRGLGNDLHGSRRWKASRVDMHSLVTALVYGYNQFVYSLCTFEGKYSISNPLPITWSHGLHVRAIIKQER